MLKKYLDIACDLIFNIIFVANLLIVSFQNNHYNTINMLTRKYLNGVKNLVPIMNKIVEGTAPQKFTTEHLKKLGFTSSNDRAIIGILKDLGFLAEDGTPTQRYHDYRNTSKSKQVLGESLKDAYTEIFHINEKPSAADRQAITGLFKSTHNVSDQIASLMSSTFLAFLSLADISENTPNKKGIIKEKKEEPKEESKSQVENIPVNQAKIPIIPNLRYNIEIHLPATKDIEVYNAIFKSLRIHLLNE